MKTNGTKSAARRMKAPEGTDLPLTYGAGIGVICASILINALAIAGPLAALLIYDKVLKNGSLSTLTILIAGAVVLVLLEAILRFARAAIVTRAAARADYMAREEVMRRTLAQPVSWGKGLTLPDLNARLAAVVAPREYRFTKLQACVDIPFGFAFLLLICGIGGWLVLLPALVCVAFALITLLLAVLNARSTRQVKRYDHARQNFAMRSVQSLHSLEAMAAQIPVIDRFVGLQLRRSGALKLQTRYALLSRDAFVAFSQVLIGSTVIASTLAVLDGALSLGGLAACTLLAGRALEPLQTGVQLVTLSRTSRVASEDLAVLQKTAGTAEVDIAPWSKPPALRFEEVTVPSANIGSTLLSRVSFEVDPGEIVAISTAHGAGKTTLARAMLGIVPFSGTITIGQTKLTTSTAPTLRERITYLPREPELPSGRMLDVLTDGDEGSYADIRYLAHLLGLDEAVKRLPGGYETMIDLDGSAELSLGVRQQIAICRALARKSKLIVVDDTSFSLDAPTELRFEKVLRMLRSESTMVLLTDRPNLMALADRRLVLSEGRLHHRPRPVVTAA